MKTLSIFLLIITLFSCKNEKIDVKKDSATSPETSVTATSNTTYLTAKIDGKDISATMAVLALEVTVKGLTTFTIATEDKKNKVSLQFIYKTLANDVPEDVLAMNRAFSVEYDGKGYMAVHKNINFAITKETDSHLEGTFSFTAKQFGGKETIAVSDGEFKAKKQ